MIIWSCLLTLTAHKIHFILPDQISDNKHISAHLKGLAFSPLSFSLSPISLPHSSRTSSGPVSLSLHSWKSAVSACFKVLRIFLKVSHSNLTLVRSLAVHIRYTAAHRKVSKLQLMGLQLQCLVSRRKKLGRKIIFQLDTPSVKSF